MNDDHFEDNAADDHSPEWVTSVSDVVVATSDDVLAMQRTGAPEWLVERIQSLT